MAGASPGLDGRQTGPLRVIVVGAGFAGLSAARTLALHPDSVAVTVLEASDAVGGRARTGQLPSGSLVEMGATWFHGVRDNPVYDMAVWQGLVKDVRNDPEAQKHDIDWQLHFARPMEQQLLSGNLQDVAMEAVGRYTEAAEECTAGAQLGDGSVGDVLRRTYDEVITSEGLQGPELQAFADAWHFREKLQRTFDGFFSTDDVSLAFAKEYEALDGPNLAVPGGYQGLARMLAAGLDVRCSHRVASIQYGHSGVLVTCTNGAAFAADCVLVTTSLGVLQAGHGQLFRPSLPQWKAEALGALRIGVADKIFVEFDIALEKAKEAAAWLSTHASSSPGRSGATGARRGAGSGSAVPSPASDHAARVTSPPMSSPAPVDSCVAGRDLHTSASPHGTRAAADSGIATHTAAHVTLSDDASAAPGGGRLADGAAALTSAPSGHVRSGVCGAATAPIATERMHAAQAAQAAATTTAGVGQVPVASSGRSATTGSGGGPRRRKHRRTIHSYAFMWPVADPASQGVAGHPAAVASALDQDPLPYICADRLAPLPSLVPGGLVLPSWLQGLHSIRFCPGPEWIEQPAVAESGVVSSGGKRSSADVSRPAVSARDGGASHVSAVLWITGREALAMEAASEADVQEAITGLFSLFPQVPLPPGAILPPRVLRTSWGTDPLFSGSYSYIAVPAPGEAVDALAEPLCTSDGTPIVLFAGEATHKQYIGTVHGAFLSGCREAERLLVERCGKAPLLGALRSTQADSGQGEAHMTGSPSDSSSMHTSAFVLTA